MNFFRILAHLTAVDPEALGRLDSRRAVFRFLGTAARRTALAGTPALLAAYFSKAYAGSATVAAPVDIFNFALTLELLEADFYAKMIASAPFAAAAAADQAAIQQIAKHETAHVTLLQKIVQGLDGTPVTGVAFKASLFNALPSFEAQLETAQLLEDTGVRAYKGSAGDLRGLSNVSITGISNLNLLQTALQIHSVEARHAAHIRLMRGQTPWITGTGDLDARAHYLGATPESNVVQAGINLTSGLARPYLEQEAQAAFDESMTKDEVLALITPLIGI